MMGSLRRLVVDAGPGSRIVQCINVASQIADQEKGILTGVCSAWPRGTSFTEAVLHNPLDVTAQEQELRTAVAASRLAFDSAMESSTVSGDWVERIAEPGVVLSEQALLADILIMGPPKEHDFAQADPIDIAARTGVPVLRLGKTTPPEGFQRILIAWKDCREARLALTAALPFFCRAHTIMIVGLGEEAPTGCLEAVQGYLAAHDIDAKYFHAAAPKGNGARWIAEFAEREGYDLLVTGARARGRWKERIFGGMTEDLRAMNLNWLLAN
ncbi:Universal stress protein, UspA [Novosphingobium lubricantis]|uniref:universal stress protein n=1 Tax=Novosphingobium pentaromativorans TaxID=205844 RepID=UPI000B15C669|nr:universal stress protein [Novosphingobium pentaromativorans]